MKCSKKFKRLGASVLSMALVLSVLAPANVDAAKAPKFAKKNVVVNQGKTTTIKIKNGSKKAKVTWKVKSKKIAKITKATKTSAKIKGVKAGKTQVTAKYTLGKVKKTLKCTVKVNAKENKATAAPTSAPTAVPTTAPTSAPTVAPTTAPTTEPTAAPTEKPEDIWVSTWGTAEEKCNLGDNSAMPKLELEGTTVRQIVRATTSGNKIRLRLSNQYGESDVVIESLHIAKQSKDAKSDGTGTAAIDMSTIDPSTDTVITAYDDERMVIPKGEVLITDEIDFSVDALDNLAISMYFGETPTKNITGHRGARATTYQVEGNSVSEEVLSGYQTTTSWFFLADIALLSPAGSKAVVCFGDSITDGYGTDASYLGKKPDSYTRWIDYFAKRLQANESTKNVSVINEGIGSNSIMGAYPTDAGKDRFARDVLEHDGVAYCIILFGVNDLDKLPNTDKFAQLKPEYEKMIATCHDNGIKVYAAPILPFGTSSYYSEGSEAVRTMINDWFRSEESQVDGIIDFESALADPANPTNLLYEYTKEDGLHPYEGYSAMADAIDLKMFE